LRAKRINEEHKERIDEDKNKIKKKNIDRVGTN
jgi:hypothetical protein